METSSLEEAQAPLNEARDLFARLEAAPRLAETDALLRQAAPLGA